MCGFVAYIGLYLLLMFGIPFLMGGSVIMAISTLFLSQKDRNWFKALKDLLQLIWAILVISGWEHDWRWLYMAIVFNFVGHTL